jgi:hypothetical protein
MANIDLSTRETEAILDGVVVPERADLVEVAAVTAFIRASRDIEPPPPMSADLLLRLDGDDLN